MRNIAKQVFAAAVSITAISIVGSAYAGSFAIKERSTRAQGASFAGATAGSGGISSMGFNPATIALATETELAGGASLILPSADGTVNTTGQTVDPGQAAFLTNGYAAHRLDEQVLIGAMLFTPFGLTTKYESNFVGANDALTSKLLTIQISPVVGFQPIPELAFGAALHIFYIDARLTSGLVNLDGDQTTLGFSVGALWQPTSGTKVGFGFDYGYELELTGNAQFSAAGAAAIGAPPLAGQVLPLTAHGALPATVSLGVTQDITDTFRVMGEVQWQNWSVFDRLDLSVATPVGVATLVDQQSYDDAFFVAAGFEYDVSDALTVRSGAAWDQTPTVDSNFLTGGSLLGRTPRVPDEDRLWLSVGATYDVNDHMSVDAAYSYLFTLDDPVVDLRTAPGSTVTYKGQVHIFSVGGSLKF